MKIQEKMEFSAEFLSSFWAGGTNKDLSFYKHLSHEKQSTAGLPIPWGTSGTTSPTLISFHLQSFQPHRQLRITQQNGHSGPLGAFSKSTLSSTSASSLLEARRTMAELTTRGHNESVKKLKSEYQLINLDFGLWSLTGNLWLVPFVLEQKQAESAGVRKSLFNVLFE